MLGTSNVGADMLSHDRLPEWRLHPVKTIWSTSDLIQLRSAPPRPILLKRDLLSQKQGTIWHPQQALWELLVWPVRQEQSGFPPGGYENDLRGKGPFYKAPLRSETVYFLKLVHSSDIRCQISISQARMQSAGSICETFLT